ncbi:hypothetical protein [Lacipirellula sp.]|uniref:hypothetical protein n=1 Tax=Lacipirellula sp. TaxID=2691419 RepID=UPI003D0C0D30
MSLTIDQVLAAKDRQMITVKCPEWEGDVCLLPFSGDERDWYDQMMNKKRYPVDDNGKVSTELADWRGVRAACIAKAWCNENGVKPETPITELQILALGTKSGAPIDRCYEALAKASGLAANSAEDAEKNLKPAQKGKPG